MYPIKDPFGIIRITVLKKGSKTKLGTNTNSPGNVHKTC